MGALVMATFHRSNYKIADILRWEKEDELILQPKFQRRLVWEDDARSYLIDTIVRNLPMPKIYLRRNVSPKTKLMAYEVVDGQQRLKAIIDFYDGKLVLSKRHNPELGDTTFDGLPEPLQRAFLQYVLSTEIMENATDPEVWAMFERLNTYTLTLNRQEKLNAKWFGYFKQIAYRLAAEQSALDAWKDMRVFTDRQIARMIEVELTSDVLVAIVDGISDITDTAKAYKEYDKEFPRRDAAINTFQKSLSFIATKLPEAVRTTRFRNRAWFYSLMVAMADVMKGIPKGNGPRELRSDHEIQRRMYALDVTLRPVRLPPGLADLHDALSRQTSHIPPRLVRHEHFHAMLTLSEGSWQDRWKHIAASD
jgi:hypothetical protein